MYSSVNFGILLSSRDGPMARTRDARRHDERRANKWFSKIVNFNSFKGLVSGGARVGRGSTLDPQPLTTAGLG
jgi:hypothetical protein